MGRRDAAAQELPAVDPDTGALLSAGDTAAPAALPPRPGRRLHRVAAALSGLALMSGAGAVYAGATVVELRRVERVWQAAMTLDGQRAAAEETVVTTLRSYGEGDEAAVGAIRRLGEDEARQLAGLEAQLREARILDGGLSRLRDDMVRALRFRQSALVTNRLQLDDRELRPLGARLADQRHRWRLPERRLSPVPRLAEADGARRRLEQFADEPTNTVLVGRTAAEVVVVDIDASRVHRRPAPGITGVFVWGELAIASADGRVTAHPLDVGEPPRWSVPGTSAFPAVEPELIWVAAPDGVRLVDLWGATVSPPVRLPARRTAVAATTGGLVLIGESGGIEVWQPTSGALLRTVSRAGRLVAASKDSVAWQEPDATVIQVTPVTRDADVRHYPLRRTDAGPGAFSPDSSLLAVPAGPPAGAIARVVVVDRDDPGLRVSGGPATTFADASLAWSAGGDWLFWKTRDGRVALQRHGKRDVRVLRADLGEVLSFVTAVAA
ncbi:MAG: hypothetical protein KY454_11145 [Actinobacteria bacterium]|nr:hypothetical protein [Actinomycetota bacterium]